MIMIETMREFLGWCTVVNCGVLALSAIIVLALRGPISRLHARMFGLEERVISRTYFQYLALYKLFILGFNLVPYLVLRIMG